MGRCRVGSRRGCRVYAPNPPELLDAIISPSDTANVVVGKLTDYFAAGTSLVWLVYPVYRQVEAHMPGQKTLIFTESGTLEASDLLPGFGCKVTQSLQ